MGFTRHNLHNHTTFSDGKHDPAAVIDAAARSGLTWVGISDHFFSRKIVKKITYREWLDTTFAAYQVARLQQRQAPKKAEAPLVWWGFEIDTCEDRLGMKIEQLPWDRLNELDFISLEYVGEPDKGGMAIDRLATVRGVCKVPLVLAHPALGPMCEVCSLDRIAEALGKNNVWCEVVAGTRNYWWFDDPTYWPLLHKVTLVLGSDTHEHLDEVGDLRMALAFLQDQHLLERLATPPIPRSGTASS